MENSYSLENEHQILNISRMGSWRTPDSKENNLYGLFDFIKHHDLKNKKMIEIGCYLGISTELFAMFCKEITSIDLWGMDETYDGGENPKEYWPIIEKQARDRLSKYTNVTLIKDNSLNASKNFENELLDLVYLDGNHSYDGVINDVSYWYNKIKIGGVLSGHDYNQISVKKAVDEIIIKYNMYDLKIFNDTSWSLIK
jgi:hypothetical protein